MKILVAVDKSKNSEKVLRAAAGVAKQSNAKAEIYMVAEQMIDSGESFGVDINSLILKATLEDAGELKKLAAKLGLVAKVIVESGASVADMILEQAKKEDIDLIVMGSRARTGIDRFLLGSVASKVVAHAACSVLVVR